MEAVSCRKHHALMRICQGLHFGGFLLGSSVFDSQSLALKMALAISVDLRIYAG